MGAGQRYLQLVLPAFVGKLHSQARFTMRSLQPAWADKFTIYNRKILTYKNPLLLEKVYMARSVLRTIDTVLYRSDCEQEVINVHQRSMQVSKPQSEDCKVYPNPANTELNVTFTDGSQKTIELYNYLGEKVFTMKTSDTENTIAIEKFRAGVYTIKISSDTEILSTQNITIIH